jgi:hypothetical protein
MPVARLKTASCLNTPCIHVVFQMHVPLEKHRHNAFESFQKVNVKQTSKHSPEEQRVLAASLARLPR